jgi:hypothetical protein
MSGIVFYFEKEALFVRKIRQTLIRGIPARKRNADENTH